MAKIFYLYTLLDIMIMMLLDHYAQKYQKYVTGYINEFNENKNTITMSLRANDERFKNIIKYGKKLRS